MQVPQQQGENRAEAAGSNKTGAAGRKDVNEAASTSPPQQPPKQLASWSGSCDLCSLSHMTAMGCFFCCAAGIAACTAAESSPGCASDCSTVQSPMSPTAASEAS